MTVEQPEKAEVTSEEAPSAPSRNPVRVMAYAITACFLSVVIMCASTIVYVTQSNNETLKRADQANHRFCALVLTLDDSYQAAKPTTPTGILVATEIHQLTTDLGCRNPQEGE